VLLVVGIADQRYISEHKRLQEYGIDDFNLLKTMIRESVGLVVPPNALTEAPSLLRQIDQPENRNRTNLPQADQQHNGTLCQKHRRINRR
jgi:hypothetical protein